jgi:hypothetical protein
METKYAIRIVMTGYNLGIDTEVVMVQESRLICLEDPAEGHRHSTHEQPRQVRRDAKSGSSVEKDRLVGKCNTGCQSGRVGPIDIRSNILVGVVWSRIGALYID